MPTCSTVSYGGFGSNKLSYPNRDSLPNSATFGPRSIRTCCSMVSIACYHLIDEQPNRAKQTLLTFSNLLRYQLYECQVDRVPLDKELVHLTDYITLEETRKGEDAIIAWDVKDHDSAGQIAPMLLQPFVENAFKHLSYHENPEQNRLNLSLGIDQGVLSLSVENTVSTAKKPKPAPTEGGFGLTNVRRRLQLIYPDRHQLFVSQPPGRFHVHLIITL